MWRCRLCEGHNDTFDFDGMASQMVVMILLIPLSTNVTSEGTADLNYSSNVDIYGFQFQVTGVSLTAVSGDSVKHHLVQAQVMCLDLI